MGIVTVQDGPSLAPGEIIAPAVGVGPQRQGLPQQLPGPRGVPPRRRPPGLAVRAADRRHLLHQPLVRHARVDPQDGRADRLCRAWSSATTAGAASDLSGDTFRHGERVAEGERGVLEKPLGPGKYAFNTYAGNIVLVPTTNFVLHWVTGRTESHRYDESLRSIDLVTKDAYEPPAAALGRRPHRLPEGAERDPAVRRREEADHPDARPDAQRLLPRRRPQEDDAPAAPGARRDPARGQQRAAAGSSTSSTSSASTS